MRKFTELSYFIIVVLETHKRGCVNSIVQIYSYVQKIPSFDYFRDRDSTNLNMRRIFRDCGILLPSCVDYTYN